jgi:predicted nuclease with TOPRIM domain
LYGFVLILTIAVLGGLLALLGDRVGMRMGKKKLTLFGLRPKYTSMVITVLTGLAISGLTLVLMAVVSDDVRTALFHMKQIRRELTVLKIEYQETQEKLGEVLAEQEKTEELLVATEAYYREAAATLERTRKELHENKEELAYNQKRLHALEEVIQGLEETKVGLEVEKERLHKEVQVLAAEASTLRDNLEITKTGRLIFLSGDILAARVVEGGKEPEEVIAEVFHPMLAAGNKIALERGARLRGKEEYSLKVKDDLSVLAKEIAGLEGPAVLRLVVDHNTVLFEPLYTSFQVFPDQRIFCQGEIIAEDRIEPDLEEEEILDRILRLLLVVRKKALDKGMISEGQYIGEVASLQEAPELIKKIREGGQMVTVQLVAVEDVWRTRGPLKVEIKLEEEIPHVAGDYGR